MNRLSLLILLLLLSVSLSACGTTRMRKFEAQADKRMYQRMTDRISGSVTPTE